MSQSLFLVRLDIQDRNGIVLADQSKSACGVSRSSFLTLFIILSLLIFVVAIFSFLRLQVDIPFAASCSLTISAACHPQPNEVGIELKPVKWGVVSNQIIPGTDHCAFSAHAVQRPRAGVKYA